MFRSFCLSWPQWHYLRFNYLLQVVSGIESAVDVAAGGMHTAVLDSNGKVSDTRGGKSFNGFINVSNIFTPTSQLAKFFQRFGPLAVTMKGLWAGILKRKKTVSFQARWVI